MIPRIKKIVSMEPYKVTCVWNTSETRLIDFGHWIDEAKTKPESVLNKLSQLAIFMTVVLDTEQENIIWPNLITMNNLNDSKELVGLDFSPEVLYGMSKPADVAK